MPITRAANSVLIASPSRITSEGVTILTVAEAVKAFLLKETSRPGILSLPLATTAGLERLTESSHGQLLYELAHPRADGGSWACTRAPRPSARYSSGWGWTSRPPPPEPRPAGPRPGARGSTGRSGRGVWDCLRSRITTEQSRNQPGTRGSTNAYRKSCVRNLLRHHLHTGAHPRRSGPRLPFAPRLTSRVRVETTSDGLARLMLTTKSFGLEPSELRKEKQRSGQYGRPMIIKEPRVTLRVGVSFVVGIAKPPTQVGTDTPEGVADPPHRVFGDLRDLVRRGTT